MHIPASVGLSATATAVAGVPTPQPLSASVGISTLDAAGASLLDDLTVPLRSETAAPLNRLASLRYTRISDASVSDNGDVVSREREVLSPNVTVD